MFCRARNKYILERKRSRPNFLFRERTFLFRDLDCQPRSDSCLAEAVGRGWTVRPRLDSPDRGKEQSSRGKGRGRDLFYSRIYLFHALQIHFFYLSNVMTPTKSLWNNNFENLKTLRITKFWDQHKYVSISKYQASKFPGVPLKIAGRRPAIFQIRYPKKLT